MITFIVGETGAGKSALVTYILQETYMTEGVDIWKRSCEAIRRANRQYGRNYTLPDRVPIYTHNFQVRFNVGYKKFFEPYLLNGFYFGISNDRIETEYVAPESVLAFDESQRIFNSRKSSTFLDAASYAFEIHRQFNLRIYLLAQRGNLIDRNIKELGVHVIEVLGMENTKNAAGYVIQSVWHCREFDNWRAAEQYFSSGAPTYRETTYTNKGNIFECFDSFEKGREFLPPKGKDFDFLPYEEPKKLTNRQKKFYIPGEPKHYRKGAS